jgi:glutamate/tyrosine decarboxylase-like PLP-dependent enzyme
MSQPATQEDLGILAPIDQMMHPYREQFEVNAQLPQEGRPRAEILAEIQQLHDIEQARWKEGFASGSVYHGDNEHVDFLNQVYAIQSQSNQLHSDLWPSAAKFEAEIVAMTANMLNADAGGHPVGSEQGICGSVSSGGSESILLAMKTYRDWAREKRGITQPELVLPVTAHAAFHKAGQYFNIALKVVTVDEDFRVSLDNVKEKITDNTIALVGSAPNFPFGTIDSIEDLSELALEHGVGLHVDACLGGFFLPWAERLGEPVPLFDFRLPGVTSMSCDTHKYGYAAKGTSVVLYRGRELRQHQYFTIADWPGGLYYSPTFSGSRPGGLSAACWAAMISMGESGYMNATRQILGAVKTMRQAVDEIDELRLLGQPVGVFSFAADGLDIYQVMDQMSYRRWALTGLQQPPALHVSPTLRHAQEGVAERFVEDLKESVAFVRENPSVEGGMAPIYGMAASIPERSIVHEMLRQVMDIYYRL